MIAEYHKMHNFLRKKHPWNWNSNDDFFFILLLKNETFLLRFSNTVRNGTHRTIYLYWVWYILVVLNISWQARERNNLCDVFQVNHEGHAYGHRETTSNGRTEGQYQVVLPDGRVQTVKYYADNSGFHPQIIYTQ